MTTFSNRTLKRLRESATGSCEYCQGCGIESEVFVVKHGSPIAMDFPCRCTIRKAKAGGATIEGSIKAIKDIWYRTGPKDMFKDVNKKH